MMKSIVEEKAKIWQTILVIVVGFLILFLIFKNKYLIYSALSIGLVSLISPQFAYWLDFVWFKIAHVLGWINTRILLTFIFFFILFPLALLARMTRKNPFNLKKTTQESYFVSRNYTYTAKDLENPW